MTDQRKSDEPAAFVIRPDGTTAPAEVGDVLAVGDVLVFERRSGRELDEWAWASQARADRLRVERDRDDTLRHFAWAVVFAFAPFAVFLAGILAIAH